MTFWQFITTGIDGVKSERHKRFAYANAVTSTLVTPIVGGLTSWVTGGWLWAILSAAAAITAVYLISFILFTEGSR